MTTLYTLRGAREGGSWVCVQLVFELRLRTQCWSDMHNCHIYICVHTSYPRRPQAAQRAQPQRSPASRSCSFSFCFVRRNATANAKRVLSKVLHVRNSKYTCRCTVLLQVPYVYCTRSLQLHARLQSTGQYSVVVYSQSHAPPDEVPAPSTATDPQAHRSLSLLRTC
jgi:hypothetical protein